MSVACPKCGTPAVLNASEVGAAGRLVRCQACTTTWLARSYGEGTFGPMAKRTPPPVIRKQPLIIDGELVALPRRKPDAPYTATPPRLAPPIRAAASVQPKVATPPDLRHTGFLAGAAILALSIIAAVLIIPAVSTLSFADIFGGSDGVALRGVESKTLRLRGSEAIFIEGELVNDTDREMAVPNVRVSLQSEAGEVYSWVVEPSRMRIAAGQTLGFRTALAKPAPGGDRVTLTLAARDP